MEGRGKSPLLTVKGTERIGDEKETG